MAQLQDDVAALQAELAAARVAVDKAQAALQAERCVVRAMRPKRGCVWRVLNQRSYGFPSRPCPLHVSHVRAFSPCTAADGSPRLLLPPLFPLSRRARSQAEAAALGVQADDAARRAGKASDDAEHLRAELQGVRARLDDANKELKVRAWAAQAVRHTQVC